MELGDVLAGRYRVEERLGAGGMGVVWRATDLELRRPVAIKQTVEGDLRREARIGAGLQHPNVIAVFDVLEDGLLVMEYLPSRTLAQVVRDDGPLPPATAALVGAQVAGALDAMHAKGMVHRDITPTNILVAGDGTAKLTDLGIAMWAGVTVTGDERTPGTPGYLAPEVVAGHVPTSAADMYALGVTLSAAVEGNSTVWLDVVLSALTHESPKRRPSAAQARQMLEEVTGGVPPRPRIPRWLRTSAVVVVLVAALVAGAVLWWPFGKDEPASVFGSPRTVDPCGFIDKAPLARFGTAELERDFGEYNRCDIWVSPDGTDENETHLWVSLERGTEYVESNRAEYLPEDGDACERLVVLPDRFQVRVTASHEAGVPGDRCAMADALFTNVLSVVNSGDLPRTAAPERPSIAALDACALLTTADVDRVVRGLSREPAGYGDWSCSWAGSDADVSLYFVRDFAPSSGDFGEVTDVAGREAAVDGSGDFGEDTCLIRVVYRSYRSDGHEGEETTAKTEQFRIEVSGAGDMALNCRRAKELATAAAHRLPT